MTTHKGAKISKAYVGYEWYHPDYYDADIDGQYGGGYGATIEECIEQIDEFMEGLNERKEK